MFKNTLLGLVFAGAIILAGAIRAQAEDAPEGLAVKAKYTVVVFGDSLAAGLGLTPEEGFVGQLQTALKAKGVDAEVINAGVSGDTTDSALARTAVIEAMNPTLVIVELGGNDVLRGIPPQNTFTNLEQIVKDFKAMKAKVLLAGMRAPLNMGQKYVDEFNGIYKRIADEQKVALYPFFLNGVALDPSMQQAGDAIHPNPEGVAIIVEGILPYVRGLLEH